MINDNARRLGPHLIIIVIFVCLTWCRQSILPDQPSRSILNRRKLCNLYKVWKFYCFISHVFWFPLILPPILDIRCPVIIIVCDNVLIYPKKLFFINQTNINSTAWSNLPVLNESLCEHKGAWNPILGCRLSC